MKMLPDSIRIGYFSKWLNKGNSYLFILTEGM